ncbi:GNAT family N-acetyltransferase [Ichthyenterobacterium sp. W332]|uniref:GNAT family N-acetyltransferase n=1 Tax=Microcosmobacter mediterraneus TaxID=3075607 RepID=A0ABU2YLJ6_9FLAO|nr:GNAT family N-acetyltransferase [Ichthyenterobacterium sp. W332]MDT0558145.1 GNAT family N-acetyltransferase [Ichthyenterobacterium sp. W332]
MSTIIRKATIEDIPRVLDLIQELADYEKEPNEVELTVKDLQQDGFGSQPKFNCFVAEVNSKIEGIALVYPRYSTWKGEALHLEDLIVSESKRGLGIGGLLLDEVVKFGHSKGVKRISWEVLDWNEPAISFYEKKGAKVLRDWDVVQLNEQGIKQYITNIN